ncbi:hypothetical protein OIU34_24840 [Pararhizobium sp. BT-229]|uniref:hypothetical protein n=1 Tax=Pararhizobium sp. BT-229 TaxID=2986923 RepID=UPI0021F6ABFB|nr:hypothetical protein [Pararhizobium sp. BT-229]MCV9965113.1 hypothetical protein [Pararhizobium sp. BT-229]
MSDQETKSRVQVLRVEDIDEELFEQIMNAQYGVASGDEAADVVVKDHRDERIERLEDILYDIALMADRHKASALYVEGDNVALVTIRNMAAEGIGKGHLLREKGTLLAVRTAVVDRD